ncbi:hypothetical protein ASPTUDRAFT_67223 [Aspergillus tubingensis CBS 134.48]|uniref:Uncharacterized protein n=1 Tax=Aspergillus tubingensis (strain CBS 134.48) TaxID=767770 RepID=A0A1L9N1P6_ASPTC|nr:hypothetical protein ASPTUDRAFT_67223 [Aspergillus tubingensis CBS 134.48]
MSLIPTTLYYAAAVINAISIPGHISFGINEVDPAIAEIPEDRNAPVVVSSLLLNIKWSKYGVRTWEEKIIIGTSVLAGTLTGWRYFEMRCYGGLGCLWAAPSFTMGAMISQQLGRL